LSQIESMLATRVTEFVATMNQLLERTSDTTGKMDDHIGQFYGVTTKTLHGLTELSSQFDGQGRSLAQAVELVEMSNRKADEVLGARRAALDEVVTSLDGRTADLDGRLQRFSGLLQESLGARTDELDTRLKRFSDLLDESLAAAEARARDIARVVADSTAEGTRAIAEQHEAVRMTSEQERTRTMDGLRTLYEQATNEAHMLFRENAGDAQTMLAEAKERFNDIVSSVKQMAADMQRELDTTRNELRRGILELPQETAESAAQMRRVIVDQIEALAELNRIVARHGRGMDAQQSEPTRRAQPEESVVVSMGGRVPRPVAPTPMQAPPMPPATQYAPPRRAEAPSLSPPQGPGNGTGPGMGPPPVGPNRGGGAGGNTGGGAGGGWLTDLLNRASREDGPRPDERPRMDDRLPMMRDDRPPPRDDRPTRNSIESLDSLSVDIARMIDHNAAIELWDRYNRGERNVFNKRLYTMQGQKAFDEISKRYRGDREFKQTVDRYIGEFERLLEEVSRDDRGQVVARSYLTSETGKVYTMLAHAAGRFD
jgi:ABC-type transporter Mla subunit MlaD